eukprot:10299553-Lingulodinium_polyedra.AAC.1
METVLFGTSSGCGGSGSVLCPPVGRLSTGTLANIHGCGGAKTSRGMLDPPRRIPGAFGSPDVVCKPRDSQAQTGVAGPAATE